MKKLILLSVLLLVLISGFSGVDFLFSKTGNVRLQNIEALARGESGKDLWFRTDEDCEYTYTGKAGSSFSITVAGQTITGTYDRNGEYTYTVSDGQTHCESGGHQQCTARYCD